MHNINLPYVKYPEKSKKTLHPKKGKRVDNKKIIGTEFQNSPSIFSIKWKFAAASAFFLMLIFSCLLVAINTIFKTHATTELENRALTIAKSTQAYGTTPILGNRMDLLNGLVGEIARLDPDIAYILIDLPEKNLLFHNLSGGLPDTLFLQEGLKKNESYRFRFLENNQTGIREATVSLLGNQGSISVGISDHRSMQNIHKNQIRLSLVMGVAIIIGVLFSILLARKITNPLVSLSQAFDRISLGDLNAEIIQIKSKDEIKILADSFERMRNSFSKAMERLRER